MQSFVSMLEDWWAKPFNPDGDALDWILFLGLIVVALIAWKRVVDKIV